MSAYSITTRGLAGRKVPQGTLTAMGALLFGSSEQGAWYDPSDLSTLFQDSAGTTPVTAMEQFVGLILDKSKGLVLGPELVVSQDLTTWTSGGVFGNWGPSTATASVLTSTSTSGSRHVRFACTPGTTITASAMGSMAGIATGARLAIAFGTSGYAYISVVHVTTTSTSPTQLRVIGTAPSNAAFCEIVVRADGASGSQATFTDVSAKELPSNHASQATSTKRGRVSRRVNWLPATETFSGYTLNGATVPTDGAFDGSAILRLQENASTGDHRAYAIMIGLPAGAKMRAVVYAKHGTGNRRLALFETNRGGARFDLTTGLAFTDNFGTAANMTAASDGMWKCQVDIPLGVAQTSAVLQFRLVEGSSTTGYTGDGASHVLLSKPSFTLAIDTHLPYQWVNTSTDYDADPAKFPAFGLRDGVDDSISSSTGGGGAAGFFFSSIVTPLGSAGTNRTLFSDAGTNTGYIVRLNTSNQLELSAGNGTAYTTIATSGTLAVSATDVVQAWDDGTNLNVKIGNGLTASIARPAVAAGTAGYTLGQDNGASTGYFNGRSYSEIYRKDSGLTQSQREAVAVYQRQKARMP